MTKIAQLPKNTKLKLLKLGLNLTVLASKLGISRQRLTANIEHGGSEIRKNSIANAIEDTSEQLQELADSIRKS